jgi:predicted unusual protein kinase regulating ubiquinone biosynthesis (AarF/ABC1/UbiB family)
MKWNKASENRLILREENAEKRQVRRERQETIRKHWQELQSNLIFLQRAASHLSQLGRFVRENNDTHDATTRHLLMMMTNRLPEVLSQFDEGWARVVAQLNVFPSPRDLLALEILEIIQELGETVKEKQAEVKNETLLALANLVVRVADVATLPNPD